VAEPLEVPKARKASMGPMPTEEFLPSKPRAFASGAVVGLLIALVTIASLHLIVLTILVFRGSPAASQVWEYKVTSINDTSFTDEMNELGKEGWELVFARRARDDFGSFRYEIIAKRPRR
jgi:hypothetical protein